MDTRVLNTGERINIQDGFIQSINPPETLFGFTYWSYMIPPEEPKSTLILGYGNGTISALIKRIWPYAKVTGIDIRECKDRNLYTADDNVKIMDAWRFLNQCHNVFDYVVIDLYNGNELCDFVSDPIFIKRLKDVCEKRIAINLFSKYLFVSELYASMFRLEFVKSLPNQEVVFFRV